MKRKTMEVGSSGLVFAAMLPAVLAFVGLLVDGGAVLRARRETQIAADSAVLAASQQVDWDAFEADNTLLLPAGSAASVGTSYAALNAPGSSTACAVAGLRVTCTTQRVVPFAFLPIFGLPSLVVSSTATGQLLYGITGDGE